MTQKTNIEKAWALVDRIDAAVLNLFLDMVPLLNAEQVTTYIDALEIYASLSDAVKRIKNCK